MALAGSHEFGFGEIPEISIIRGPKSFAAHGTAVNFRPAYARQSIRPCGALRPVGGIIKSMVVLGLLGTIAWLAFQKTVHHQLRDQIQSKLDEKLAGTAISASVGAADFVEGKGIRLNDLRLSIDNQHHFNDRKFNEFENPSAASVDFPVPMAAAHSSATNIEIYEAFLHMPVSMTELVTISPLPIAIEIRRAKLQLTQTNDGDWNMPQLIGELAKLKDPNCGPIPVAFTDCTIELLTPDRNNNPLQLTDVSFEVLPIQHEGRSLLQIRGQFNGKETSGASFTAFIDSAQRIWQGSIAVQEYRITDNLVALLPPKLRSKFLDLPKMTGTLALAGSATGDLDLKTEPQFQLSGRLQDFACDDPNLPLPIRQTSLEFSLDNQQVKISNARGRLGQGSFQAGYQQSGLFPPKRWSVTGELNDFNFSLHQKFSNWLPNFCVKLCEEYSPGGTANIQFEIGHNGQRLNREVHGQLTDMSFSYFRMPYQVDHCTGEVDLVGDDCVVSVRSLRGQQVMELKGTVQNPGPGATYQINLLVPGDLPIDDKLLSAIEAQPKLAKVVKDFNPTGRVGGIGRIEKSVDGGPISKSFDLRFKQCIVKHNSFDYPIHNVNGLVQVRNDEYSFVELTGHNSSAEIACNGTWNPVAGLDLRFLCKSVPLDNQLRFALRPDLREIWAGFRPRGTVDLIRVDMTLPIEQLFCDVEVDATMSKPRTGVEPNLVSINPVWFPYEIKRLTGNVKIGNGKIVLTDMAGRHGRSWLVCQGEGDYSDESWSVKLQKLLVGSLKIDDDLLAAVPRSLAPPIRQLSFDGMLNVHGEVTLAGQQSRDENGLSEAANSLAWNLRFDMNQAEMMVGLPLKNVFGRVDLEGTYDGYNAECRGDLAIDSLTIYEAQITNVTGPIWLDNVRTAAGLFASPTADPQAANFAPVPATDSDLKSITGTMHGGVVKFDAQMSSDPSGEFYLQTTLADGNLQQCCREFAPQLTDVSGRSFAALRLTGNYLGTHSYRGDGTVQLRDAKIYELPVMLSLLKILKIREATRTAFDSSNVDFTVAGEDIELNRIEMLGDAISLLGNGKINLNRDIDLNFYSVMGRNRINIPVISDMYRASSQQVLWINVDGTLDNPKTHRNVLPQINDSLKQLFQPPAANRMAKSFDGRPQVSR